MGIWVRYGVPLFLITYCLIVPSRGAADVSNDEVLQGSACYRALAERGLVDWLPQMPYSESTTAKTSRPGVFIPITKIEGDRRATTGFYLFDDKGGVFQYTLTPEQIAEHFEYPPASTAKGGALTAIFREASFRFESPFDKHRYGNQDAPAEKEVLQMTVRNYNGPRTAPMGKDPMLEVLPEGYQMKGLEGRKVEPIKPVVLSESQRGPAMEAFRELVKGNLESWKGYVAKELSTPIVLDPKRDPKTELAAAERRRQYSANRLVQMMAGLTACEQTNDAVLAPFAKKMNEEITRPFRGGQDNAVSMRERSLRKSVEAGAGFAAVHTEGNAVPSSDTFGD